MRKSIIIILILSLIFSIFNTSINALGVEVDRSEIDVYDIAEAERNDIAGGLELEILNSNSTIYEDNFITGFDVSENGELAIAFDDSTILVMTFDLRVRSVLKAPGYSSHFALDWNGKYIDIVSRWRTDSIVSITPDGEIVDADKYIYTDKTYDYLHELDYNRNVIEYNGYKFQLKNSEKITSAMGGGKWDTLVRIDETGNEKVIFKSEKSVPDNVSNAIFAIIFVFVLIPLFFIFVIVKHKSGDKS